MRGIRGGIENKTFPDRCEKCTNAKTFATGQVGLGSGEILTRQRAHWMGDSRWLE